MTTFLMVAGTLWAIGAVAGCVAYASELNEDPANYARSIFWPFVALVFLCKGVAKMIAEM